MLAAMTVRGDLVGRSAAPGPAARVRRGRAPAVAAVLVAALLWSASFAVTKGALAEIPPMTIGAIRFGLAALILAGVVRMRRDRRLPTGRQRLSIGLVGLLGIWAYFAVENLGVDLATASDATLIVASYPILTLALELVPRRATLSVVRLTGMVVAAGGVWLVVRGGASGDAENRLWGDVLLILGGLVWAAYNLVAQRDASGASAVVVTYYQTLAGALVFVATSLFEADRWAWPSPATAGRLAFLAGFCSVAAFLLYNYGLRTLQPSVAVNLLNIVPVAGLAWAMLLTGESVGVDQAVGGAVVVAGVAIGLYQRESDRRERDTSGAVTDPATIEPGEGRRMTGSPEHKCAIVVTDELPRGLAVNAASVLSLTMGHRVDGLVGADVTDADGVTHPGVVCTPLPILTAPHERVGAIARTAAEQDGLLVVSFSSLAQGCRTYEEHTDRMAATPTAELASVGVGLYGPRKRVDRLVGSLPLLR
jgi:drug/metabolite transporter (DMT)-like permease